MSLRRLVLILCTAALAAGTIAPAAGAQSGSGPLLSPPTETVDTTPPPDEEQDDGLSALQQLLILLGAAALIGGIGYAIWHDARKHAPAEPKRQLSDEEAGGPAKTRQRARERDKRRAKAKQARKQRKRNR